MTDLEQCSCGGEANRKEAHKINEANVMWVECDNCGIRTREVVYYPLQEAQYSRALKEVISLWNTRQPAIDWKPIETINKNPKEWLLLRTAKGAIVKGCYAYTHDKDYIGYMLVSGEIATTHIDDFIEWREINE